MSPMAAQELRAKAEIWTQGCLPPRPIFCPLCSAASLVMCLKCCGRGLLAVPQKQMVAIERDQIAAGGMSRLLWLLFLRRWSLCGAQISETESNWEVRAKCTDILLGSWPLQCVPDYLIPWFHHLGIHNYVSEDSSSKIRKMGELIFLDSLHGVLTKPPCPSPHVVPAASAHLDFNKEVLQDKRLNPWAWGEALSCGPCMKSTLSGDCSQSRWGWGLWSAA